MRCLQALQPETKRLGEGRQVGVHETLWPQVRRSAMRRFNLDGSGLSFAEQALWVGLEVKNIVDVHVVVAVLALKGNSPLGHFLCRMAVPFDDTSLGDKIEVTESALPIACILVQNVSCPDRNKIEIPVE